MDRREALKSLLRGSILITLGAFTWLGYKNDKIVTASDCGVNNRCDRCNKFTSCNLPKAKKQQQNGRR
ncbi:MAG: hypothetical protein Q8908_04235 [Bacteroidota bacterium]|nr:hypothetical protein [Bacteroidota bacterium]